MRALALVVNDIARAMKRQGKYLCNHEDSAAAQFAGRVLINYSESLRSATKRKTKRVGMKKR